MEKKMCYVESTKYMLVRNSKIMWHFLFSLIFWLNIYSQISNSLIEPIKLSVSRYISYTHTKKVHTLFSLSFISCSNYFFLFFIFFPFLIYFITSHERKKHKPLFTKSLSTHIFYHDMSSSDFIWLCY